MAFHHGSILHATGHPLAHARGLEPLVDLGPGLDPKRCGAGLARLCAEPDVRAVVAFGSRARGEARADSNLDLAMIMHQPHLTGAERMAPAGSASPRPHDPREWGWIRW